MNLAPVLLARREGLELPERWAQRAERAFGSDLIESMMTTLVERRWFQELRLMRLRELEEAWGLIVLEADELERAFARAHRGGERPPARRWLAVSEVTPGRFWSYPAGAFRGEGAHHLTVLAPHRSDGVYVLAARSLTLDDRGEVADEAADDDRPCAEVADGDEYDCTSRGCAGECLPVVRASADSPSYLFHCVCL